MVDVAGRGCGAKDGERVVELKPGYALPHDESVGGKHQAGRAVITAVLD